MPRFLQSADSAVDINSEDE